ncbi:hypothetical protein LUR34_02625, partial [Klebsiella pneumoniae subsp. pneumoniae]|nr:hypothetical protein [Klebsiella pneumoniae subsp. pneumoniae]
MSNVFVQQPAIQKLLRDSAGLGKVRISRSFLPKLTR